MSRVLATYNLKGGVGKTSAAVNLAYLAAREHSHTLLWDLDPRGASTLDCPPSISLVSESVFEAAHALLVPLIPATLSSRTLEQLQRLVTRELDSGPQVLAFFSMVDGRKRSTAR